MSVEPFKNATIKISPPNLTGSGLWWKSLFTTTLYVVLMEINNFDNGEREEKESCIDKTAQEKGVYGMIGKGVARNFGVWSN